MQKSLRKNHNIQAAVQSEQDPVKIVEQLKIFILSSLKILDKAQAEDIFEKSLSGLIANLKSEKIKSQD